LEVLWPTADSGGGCFVRLNKALHPLLCSTSDFTTDLNLPLCGLSAALTILFLDLPTPAGSLREKLSRMDWM
jgi:hypothetical protein